MSDNANQPPQNTSQMQILQGVRNCVNSVKDELSEVLGLHPIQILTCDHDVAPDAEFTFTAEQLCDYWERLNSAAIQTHTIEGNTFTVVAEGKYGDPLDTYMPATLLSEAEGVLKDAAGSGDDDPRSQ